MDPAPIDSRERVLKSLLLLDREGEAPAEPVKHGIPWLGGSLALPLNQFQNTF